MRAGIPSRGEGLRLGQVKEGVGEEREPTTEAPGTLTAEKEPGNSWSQRAKWGARSHLETLPLAASSPAGCQQLQLGGYGF